MAKPLIPGRDHSAVSASISGFKSSGFILALKNEAAILLLVSQFDGTRVYTG